MKRRNNFMNEGKKYQNEILLHGRFRHFFDLFYNKIHDYVTFLNYSRKFMGWVTPHIFITGTIGSTQITKLSLSTSCSPSHPNSLLKSIFISSKHSRLSSSSYLLFLSISSSLILLSSHHQHLYYHVINFI